MDRVSTEAGVGHRVLAGPGLDGHDGAALACADVGVPALVQERDDGVAVVVFGGVLGHGSGRAAGGQAARRQPVCSG